MIRVCGGVGENSVNIRERVCADMQWLGISIDPVLNQAGQMCVSTGAAQVLVIPTDEERIIARAVSEHLHR